MTSKWLKIKLLFVSAWVLQSLQKTIPKDINILLRIQMCRNHRVVDKDLKAPFKVSRAQRTNSEVSYKIRDSFRSNNRVAKGIWSQQIIRKLTTWLTLFPLIIHLRKTKQIIRIRIIGPRIRTQHRPANDTHLTALAKIMQKSANNYSKCRIKMGHRTKMGPTLQDLRVVINQFLEILATPTKPVK